MALSIWQQLANASPAPRRLTKPRGSYTKAPIRRKVVKKLAKPKGRYSKGTVRSNGTSTRKAAAPPPARRTTSSTVRYAPSSGGAARSAGGGGGVPLPSGGGSSATMSAASAKLLSDLRRQATGDVALELDPQIKARQYAISEAGHTKIDATADLQKRLGLRTTEINQMYGALDALLQNQAGKSQAAYETARGSSNAAYDTLSAQVGQNYAGAKSATAAELSRLGQDSGQANSRLAADQAFTSGQVGAQKANASSTIDAIKTAAAGEAASMRGAAAATAPMLNAQSKFATDEALTQVNRDWRQNVARLKFEIGTLAGSRKAKIEKTLRQYQAEAAQAEQDAQQLQFMNSLRAAQLGISQGQLDLAKQRLGMDAANSQNSAVMRAKELQLKIDAAKKSTAKPSTGMEKAYTYLSSYKGRVPQAQLRAALEDAVNGNSNDAGFDPAKSGQPGQIPGYSAKYLDQYLRDINLAVKARGWSTAEAQALQNALMYYVK